MIRPEQLLQKDPMFSPRIFLSRGQQIAKFALPFPNEIDRPRLRRPAQNLAQDFECPTAASRQKRYIGEIKPDTKRAMTIVGRKQFVSEAGRWQRLVESIARVLGPELAEG